MQGPFSTTLTKALVDGASRVVGALLLGLIAAYRVALAPLLHALGGPASGCRFEPSCSEYAAQSVRLHGPVGGSRLALGRLLRCHPLPPGGFDPPPAPQK